MTEVEQLYDLIKQHHGALAIACRTIAQSFAAMADLCAAIGATQNDLAPESEPESSTIPTEVRPPEMGVHKPSTVPPVATNVTSLTWDDVSPTCPTGKHALTYGGTPTSPVYYACTCSPPEGNEVAAVVAATDPTEPAATMVCEPDCALVAPHDGPCLDAEDAAVVNPEEMRSHLDDIEREVADDRKPKRSKTDLTASQWATSKHFLAYMKRAEPFKSWTAEEQNAKRDAFVAAQPADLVLHRWGQRFAKFCTPLAAHSLDTLAS